MSFHGTLMWSDSLFHKSQISVAIIKVVAIFELEDDNIIFSVRFTYDEDLACDWFHAF